MSKALCFTIAEPTAYVAGIFPEIGPRFEVVALAPFRITARMPTTPADLRPGDTVSGPTIFACVDCAYNIATLAIIGLLPLTVTTNCDIDFMRKPGPEC
jgi:acyl-coenzyme A thioesterase PaaI-like protein